MSQKISRRQALASIAALGAVAAALPGCGGGGGGGPAPAEPVAPAPVAPPVQSSFHASWTAALLDGTAVLAGMAPASAQAFNNQTLRQVMRLSLGGDTLRVKISNRFGSSPVTFSGVRVARSLAVRSDIDPATDRAVTFGGQASVTLAAGAELLSDPVSLATAPLATIALSMYFAGPTTMPTTHVVGRQTAYIVPGNQASAGSMAAAPADLRESYYGVAAVETSSTEATRLVVAFGDSITDGVASSLNAAKRYPDQLDDRLKAAGLLRAGVVNAGIAGNRWLNDFAGPSGNSRFDRDVLEVAGVTHALVMMGINDIGFSVEPAPTQEVSAQQIIVSLASAVSKARARGIKVVLGTLSPFKGAGYFSEAGEAKRQAVNAWIRGNPDVDTVVDFDGVLRSPSDPVALNPAYDSGDHLHPNDAGYAAMAAAAEQALGFK